MKLILKTSLLVISISIIYITGFSKEFTPKYNDGEYVVILHGIARSSSHMSDIAQYLNNNGYDIINVDYPSTSYNLEELIEIIQKNISTQLIDDKPVNFVGYSMGGVLTRAIINKYPPKKLGRVIQLASPNNGSEVSDFFKDNWLYNKIFGEAGQQLTTNNMTTQKLMGKVNYELGVIAGNSTIDPISSMIIPEDDDGKVSIKSTKIKEMKDHITVSSSHTFFPSNKLVHQQTLYFLKNGRFIHHIKKYK